MNRAHVIRLNPTPEQAVYFRKACGVARHAYNWALARWKDERAAGKWANTRDLKAEYNKIKGEQFPWCYEVTKCAPEQEFSNLGQAFDNYWRITDVPVVASSGHKFACGAGSAGSRSFESETFCDEAGTKVL
jgi:putative transposase